MFDFVNQAKLKKQTLTNHTEGLYLTVVSGYPSDTFW